MTPPARLLSVLDGLERHHAHPAIDPSVRAKIAEARAAIAEDPAESRRVLGWFGGLGSFWENEHLSVLDLADEGPDRVAAWRRAIEDHHVWTVELGRLLIELAAALEEEGHASPRLRVAHELLAPAVRRALTPPDATMVTHLERELRKRQLRRAGFSRLPPALLRWRLEGPDWEIFAASWNRLEPDPYMADGGRYRLRRHAVYEVSQGGALSLQPPQAHYQSIEYNVLNGGVERWLDPIEGRPPALEAAIRFCAEIFGGGPWRVECHQFRIEARPGEPGKPTPEGLHRDGVDFVLVLLVRRENVESGTTTIVDADTGVSSSFTLSEPFDAVLVDDARVRHGVTPIVPVDPARGAYRDVLVVTLKRP